MSPTAGSLPSHRQDAASLLALVDFRALVDDTVEGVYLVDTAGVCVYANPAVGEFLGYEVQDVIGAHFHTLVHHSRPDGSAMPWTDCPVYRAVTDGVEGDVDDDVLWRSDGTQLAVDYRARPLRAGGRVVGGVVTFYDASLRRAAAAELEGILATAGDAFVGIDDAGAITGWNAAAQFLLGWTPEEAVGRPLMQTIVPGRYRDEYGRRLQRLHTVDEEDLPSGPVEMTAQDRSGREIAVELTIGRMRWADGWRFHAFLRDVTERRAMARELETSETLHRRLAEHSGDLITRHGLDGRLVYVSPASTELLGLTPAELLGMNARQLVHPDDLKELPKIGVEFDDTDERSEVTFRLGHRNGHWVWVEAVRSVLRDDQGKATEIQLTTRNITDRKAREAASQQASRLESLGRLSAGLAHEINSPIQYVGDNARFLARAYEDLLGLVSRYRQVLDSVDPASHEAPLAAMREAEAGIEFDYLRDEIPIAVNQTLEGIDRVATIVRAMKTFSHPGGRDHAPADLNEALTATVTVTRPQVSGVADLRMELAALPPVLCDIAELNQAFLNLIINAADAIEETGKRGTIHLTSAVDGEHVTVRIRDTGTGIPDDVLPNIFEPFFTTKDVGRGSGQGLPLTRAVVEGHGGTLTVDSRPGDGTTFTVRLPIDRRPERAETA